MRGALTAVEADFRNRLPLLSDRLPGRVVVAEEQAVARSLEAHGLARVTQDPGGEGLRAWRLS